LSLCTRAGTTGNAGLDTAGLFDPGTEGNGEPFIVSLVLPLGAATSIKAGTPYDATFRFFTSLKSVKNEGVISIGNYAFANCAALTEASFTTVTAVAIGVVAFAHCTSLTTVNIPMAATIGQEAFYGCTSLTTVDITAASSIGASAFSNCSSLASIDLPGAVTLTAYAFSGCTALNTITLGAGLLSIGASGGYTFAECINLTNITIDPSNTAFSSSADHRMILDATGALVAYPSASGALTLPSTITAINAYAFARCTSLTSAIFPDVTSIGSSAFAECDSLTTVSLPSAGNIGSNAFTECTSLITANLPSVTSIGAFAFSNCHALSSLLSLPVTPPTLDSSGVLPNTNSGAGAGTTLTIHVPSAAALSAYTSAWGVVNPANAGTETVYGTNHKRVLIATP
ncbi:MAG: leucine-rich repeat domain-containing protein, partial [Spirochaetaceae bacterium]|nr:leucine-rich repeat domain-containing protein [Spirochaetaceae bacterium]